MAGRKPKVLESEEFSSLLDNSRKLNWYFVKPRKALVNAMTPTGITPLLLAVRWNHSEIVQALLGRGANPNHPVPGWPTPIEIASFLPSPEIFELLRGAGAKPKPEGMIASEQTSPNHPLTIFLPPELSPLKDFDPDRDEKEIRKFIQSHVESDEFQQKPNQENEISFAEGRFVVHLGSQSAEDLLDQTCQRVLDECCFEGEYRLFKTMLIVLDELDSEFHQEDVEYAFRFGRREMIQELEDRGIEIGKQEFSILLENGHYDLAQKYVDSGTIEVRSSFEKVPEEGIRLTNKMVVAEWLLERLVEDGREGGVRILAPFTTPNHALSCWHKIDAWKKKNQSDEPPAICDPLLNVPDWKSGRPDCLNNLPTRATRKLPIKSRPKKTATKKTKTTPAAKAAKTRKKKPKGGIFTFDYNNAVLFVRDCPDNIIDELQKMDGFGTSSRNLHEKSLKRMPKRCLFVVQFAKTEWSTVFYPWSHKISDQSELIAQRLARKLKTESLEYGCGDTAGFLSYSYFHRDRKKEHLYSLEGSTKFTSSLKGVDREQSRDEPYDRAQALFQELELFETGATFDAIRDLLIEHDKWTDSPSPTTGWWEEVSQIHLIRLKAN